MIPALLSSDGALVTTAAAPSLTSTFQGGFARAADHAIHTVETVGTRFVQGHMVTDLGQLCIAPGGAKAGYVNGLPVTAAGLLVTQLNQPVSPGDSWVGGIRVGPLGGVYIIDTTPVVPGGFSNGFSNGFEV